MISVVIPIYNMEEYLPHCLDSLSEQSFPGRLEVILINDGSTDSSPAICESFRQQHSNVILIHQENKGLSEARNIGVLAATGDWVYFLDSDDRLAPDALQTLLDYAETNACDMVIGSFYYAYDSYLLYDDRWFKNKEPFVLTREEAMRELILQHYFKNFAWGKLYRTEIVKKHAFRPGVHFEDSFWQHLIVNDSSSIGVVPVPLYYYRQRTDGISGSFSIRNLDLMKGNEERFRFILEHYPSLTKEAALAFWSLCFQQQNIATDKISEIHFFWNRIQKEYFDVFSSALNNSILFQTNRHCPQLTNLYLQGKRFFDHFFAKRPKKIPFPA